MGRRFLGLCVQIWRWMPPKEEAERLRELALELMEMRGEGELAGKGGEEQPQEQQGQAAKA